MIGGFSEFILTVVQEANGRTAVHTVDFANATSLFVSYSLVAADFAELGKVSIGV